MEPRKQFQQSTFTRSLVSPDTEKQAFLGGGRGCQVQAELPKHAEAEGVHGRAILKGYKSPLGERKYIYENKPSCERQTSARPQPLAGEGLTGKGQEELSGVKEMPSVVTGVLFPWVLTKVSIH